MEDTEQLQPKSRAELVSEIMKEFDRLDEAEKKAVYAFIKTLNQER